MDPPDLLQKLEQLVLEKSLHMCDKVALLLPDHLARHIARKMANLKNLYIGKEVLQKYVLGFRLQGYVRGKLLSRLKTIYWGGLWDRWEKLLGRKVGKHFEYKQRSAVQAATMSGNIIILFALLCCGEMFSVAIFMLELLKTLCANVLKSIWHTLVLPRRTDFDI